MPVPGPPPQLTITALAEGAGALELSAGGVPLNPLAFVHLDGSASPAVQEAATQQAQSSGAVLVGVAGRAPACSSALLDALAFTVVPASADEVPRTCVAHPDPDELRAGLEVGVTAAPRAAVTLVRLLRLTSVLSVADGLVAESLAYSTLLAGPEFAAWRSARPTRHVPEPPEPPVLVVRDGATLHLTLNRPDRRNAFGRLVRDGLVEGLQLALADPSLLRVELRGSGPAFCSGGDLDEFGTAPDVATAHVIRVERSAGALVGACADRVVAKVHGACVGAGVEIPAFAGRVEAQPDAFFQLPELSMGLVPGAGGTVSLTRRIGRWRTASLALTGARLEARTALAWGLVDSVEG